LSIEGSAYSKRIEKTVFVAIRLKRASSLKEESSQKSKPAVGPKEIDQSERSYLYINTYRISGLYTDLSRLARVVS
jgi:hypothetical protein